MTDENSTVSHWVAVAQELHARCAARAKEYAELERKLDEAIRDHDLAKYAECATCLGALESEP